MCATGFFLLRPFLWQALAELGKNDTAFDFNLNLPSKYLGLSIFVKTRLDFLNQQK